MLRRPGAAPGIRITEARFSFMSASHTLDISAPRVRWATRCGFFLAGFGLSVWAPLIPYVRERIPMSDATFGLLLLCVGAGSLSCMPLSGMLAARLGIRLASLGSLALLICALAIMALTDSIAWLGVALFAFGGTLGVLDILLNIQSLKVERALQRPLMSQFHGMFSLGTIAGAACLTALLTLGLSPALSTLLLVGLILVTTLAIRSGLLPDRAPAGGVMFARPTGVVLVWACCALSSTWLKARSWTGARSTSPRKQAWPCPWLAWAMPASPRWLPSPVWPAGRWSPAWAPCAWW